MSESPAHIRAKERIKAVLEEDGWQVTLEKELPSITTAGQRNYIADVYAEYAFTTTRLIMAGVSPQVIHRLIVEVDGKRGHRGKIAAAKQTLRDTTFRQNGVLTVRFNTKDIIGRKAISDSDIIREVRHWFAKA